MDSHRTQLRNLLLHNQFADQEHTFIETMFDYYIRPFHKSYNYDLGSCNSSSPVSLGIPSRSNSDEEVEYVPEEDELFQSDFQKALVNRDEICLFCWYKDQCEGAHIIAQKNLLNMTTYEEPSLLKRAGLTQKLKCKMVFSYANFVTVNMTN